MDVFIIADVLCGGFAKCIHGKVLNAIYPRYVALYVYCSIEYVDCMSVFISVDCFGESINTRTPLARACVRACVRASVCAGIVVPAHVNCYLCAFSLVGPF